jgi:hypothetical protein
MKIYATKVFYILVFLITVAIVFGFFLGVAKTAEAKTKVVWNNAEVSVYGPWEGECITALGGKITYSTKQIAVPYQMIVSKKTWKKNKSRGYRTRHFYYKQKIYFKKGSKKVTATITDCGGFKGYGRYHKGKWIPRLFDLQPAVYKALGVDGTALVKWHY